MSRVQARLRVVAVIALVLVLAGASSAAAGPLTKGSTPTVGTAIHWLDAVSAWIGGLFDFSGSKDVRKTTGKAPQGPTSAAAPALGDNAHLNNGSCIDPMGGPRCSV
jgi:putative copper export protein